MGTGTVPGPSSLTKLRPSRSYGTVKHQLCISHIEVNCRATTAFNSILQMSTPHHVAGCLSDTKNSRHEDVGSGTKNNLTECPNYFFLVTDLMIQFLKTKRHRRSAKTKILSDHQIIPEESYEATRNRGYYNSAANASLKVGRTCRKTCEWV